MWYQIAKYAKYVAKDAGFLKYFKFLKLNTKMPEGKSWVLKFDFFTGTIFQKWLTTSAHPPPGVVPRPRSTTTTRTWDVLTTRWWVWAILRCIIFFDSFIHHIGDWNLNIWFQPMIDYVDTKERQGIFFERPVSIQKHQVTIFPHLEGGKSKCCHPVLWVDLNFENLDAIWPDRENPPPPPCWACYDESWDWVSNYL